MSTLTSVVAAVAITASTASTWVANGATPTSSASTVAAASLAAKPKPTPNRGPLVENGAGGSSTAAEKRRVDRVRTPKPEWWDCSVVFGAGECTTIQLPLDYDEPAGAKTDVAVLRVPAKDQKRKIGTLFVNPGGPGGSGVMFASESPYFLAEEITERFDVVGIDPRGTNFSANAQCWRNLGEQVADIRPLLTEAYPRGRTETAAAVTAAEKFGKACSTRGKPMTASMSTAEVARDMDVVRRMVGDKKLTYLGFSYGSYLGSVYANMFPDRVRALVIDGVVDPTAWAGTKANAGVPQSARLKSGDAALKTFDEILDRCAEAGPDYCMLAERGDPHEIFDELRAGLAKEPFILTDEDTGEVYFKIDEDDLFSFMLGDMYYPDGPESIDMYLTFLLDLMAGPGDDEGSEEWNRYSTARAALVKKFQAVETAATTRAQAVAGAASLGFPYYNDNESYQSVMCTDGLNPARAKDWSTYADQAARTGDGFGRLWTWASAPCATSTWKAKDEDAFRGPWDRKTAAPVLVVGNFWDPATSYEGAVAASKLLGNARLLSSDSWGHGAYGSSACVTEAVDTYLLRGKLPAKGTRCIGDIQPFTNSLEWEEEYEDEEVPELIEELYARALAGAAGPESSGKPGVPDRLPPVVPPLPGAGPRF